MTIYGKCRYCNQQVMIQVRDEDAEDKKYLDEVASEECTCTGAREARDKKQAKEEAYIKIGKLFEDYPATKDVLIYALDSIIDEKMDKLTIKVNKTITAVLNITAKGRVRVEKKTSISEGEEI